MRQGVQRVRSSFSQSCLWPFPLHPPQQPRPDGALHPWGHSQVRLGLVHLAPQALFSQDAAPPPFEPCSRRPLAHGGLLHP